MLILNAMFGKGLGGIEQAFVDYARAMRLAGHEVLSFTHPDAAIIPTLEHHGLAMETCRNFGGWDVFAMVRLRARIRYLRPDAIVCHGNRAISLLARAADRMCPVIGVAHNYSIRRFGRLDAAFAITRDLVGKLEKTRLRNDRIFHVPNMIDIPDGIAFTPRHHHAPPVIGSMGRFVAKKGFDTFIDALALLRQDGMEFRAVLGGDGEEKEALLRRVDEAGLTGIVEFTGWVTDKRAFFDACDVFCLPSRHEPFGIVLLEAMRAGMPTVTTASEGPSEIVHDGQDALITPIGDAPAMANALARLLTDESYATRLARHGFIAVATEYSMMRAAERISRALETIVQGIQNDRAALRVA